VVVVGRSNEVGLLASLLWDSGRLQDVARGIGDDRVVDSVLYSVLDAVHCWCSLLSRSGQTTHTTHTTALIALSTHPLRSPPGTTTHTSAQGGAVATDAKGLSPTLLACVGKAVLAFVIHIGDPQVG